MAQVFFGASVIFCAVARKMCHNGFMDTYTELIKHFNGSRAAAAKHFQTSREAIRKWGEYGIPPRHALECERLTFGKVKAIDVLKDYEVKKKTPAPV